MCYNWCPFGLFASGDSGKMLDMDWKVGDRVKVSPDHYGTGLQSRLGTVLRVTPSGLIEVDMDSLYWPAGIGVVAFRPEDLLPTKSKKVKKRLTVAG